MPTTSTHSWRKSIPFPRCSSNMGNGNCSGDYLARRGGVRALYAAIFTILRKSSIRRCVVVVDVDIIVVFPDCKKMLIVDIRFLEVSPKYIPT